MDDEDCEYDPLNERGMPRRDQRGRFSKGSSGNPRGKRLQFKPDPKLPASRRRVVSSVADEEVEVKINGKTVRMTMFEANVRALAHAGIKDRIAAQRFIDLATETSERDLERRVISHQVQLYYDSLEQENERLKKRLMPKSASAVVIPWDGPLEEWCAKALLDDEKRVGLAMEAGRREGQSQPGARDKD